MCIRDRYKPGLDQEGILPMIVGTLCLIGLSLLIAVPVGAVSYPHLQGDDLAIVVYV